MRILHISDLHQTIGDAEDHRALIGAFLQDVVALSSRAPIDLVVFSGDLSFSGQAAEFIRARETLLDPLLSSLELPRGRVVLVPGNHDVDRVLVDPVIDGGLRAVLTDRDALNALMADSDQMARATRRLGRWEQFTTEFYGTEDGSCALVSPLSRVHRLTIGKTSVGVAALNSAWRAVGGEGDRRQLLLGERQVEASLDACAGSDLKVVAFHHPLDWLQGFDESRVRRLLEGAGCLVLTGHDHVTDPTAEYTTRGGANYLRVGCLYATHDYPNSYALLDVDFARSTVDVMVRSWYPAREAFDVGVNVVSGGMISLPLVTADSAKTLAKVDFHTVIGRLDEIGAQREMLRPSDSADGVLSLVHPRFLPVPYREAVAAASEAKQRLHAVEPQDQLDPGRAVIIAGPRDSGVTSALLFLIKEHYERKGTHLPIQIRFNAHFSANWFERQAREFLLRLDVRIKPSQPLPDLVCAIDDVAPFAGRGLQRLVEYVAANPRHIYVLGCHGDAHQQILQALQDAGRSAARVFLGPFGRRELRQLIRMMTGVESSELMDQVLSVIQTQRLPRTPLVMIALVAVTLRSGEGPAIGVTNLLDAYLRMLLGEGEPEDLEGLGLDARRRDYLLGALAVELIQRGRRCLGRLEAEEFFARHFREFGWGRLSPGHIVDSLLVRRILDEDVNNCVGFRHEAYQCLFAAHRMVEEPATADFIIGRGLEFGQVIEHAAALRRTDADLLRDISGLARRSADRVGETVSIDMFDLIGSRRGWSEQPSIEALRQSLGMPQVAASPEEVDEQVDQFYERSDARSMGSQELVELAPVYRELLDAASLLSSVLRSSELVKDRELKANCLREAFHLWGMATVVLAVREDVTAGARNLFREALGILEESAEQRELLDRLIMLVTTFILVLGVTELLGSAKLEAMLEEVLDDDEFMASPAHALFATITYAELRLPKWTTRLGGLFASHERHPIVSTVVRGWALTTYRSADTSDSDATQLERLLVEAHLDASSIKGRGAVQKRVVARAQLIKELRAARRRSHLATFDALDAAVAAEAPSADE